VELRAAMTLARELRIPLGAVLAMSNYEVELWFAFLWPAQEPDTSALERLCDG